MGRGRKKGREWSGCKKKGKIMETEEQGRNEEKIFRKR